MGFFTAAGNNSTNGDSGAAISAPCLGDVISLTCIQTGQSNDSDQSFIYSKRSIKAGWEEGEGLISLPRILAPPTKDAKQEVRKEGEKETLFPLKHHV